MPSLCPLGHSARFPALRPCLLYPQKRTSAAGLRCPLCAKRRHRSLFDHLVGGDQETGRDGEPQRPRGFQVDNGFELGRRLHRKVGWLVAAQDAVDIVRRLPIRGRPTPSASGWFSASFGRCGAAASRHRLKRSDVMHTPVCIADVSTVELAAFLVWVSDRLDLLPDGRADARGPRRACGVVAVSAERLGRALSTFCNTVPGAVFPVWQLPTPARRG